MRLNYLYSKYVYKPLFRPRFKHWGKESLIVKPMKITNPEFIYLGKKSIIHDYGWLAASPDCEQKTPSLIIGDSVSVGHFSHIYCTNNITIGNHVLIADKVYIADNSHTYLDINKPIHLQSIKQLDDVVIGEGTWIGENACIIGCKIGKNCTIGANAIVKNDVPDYSVVVGNPGKVIKQFDQVDNCWRKI
jgi:acetyltransferase-like isoleucine patch superfamily enzyme